jgi:hypothetical protein
MRLLAVVGSAAAAIGYGTTASADTLEWALVQAYQNNPSLNAQRGALRAIDENVPQALSLSLMFLYVSVLALTSTRSII